MGGKRITDYEEMVIKMLYDKGNKIGDISNKTGMAKSRMYKALDNQNGVKVRRRNKYEYWSDKDKQLLKSLLANGYGITAISKVMNRSYCSVRSMYRKVANSNE